MIRFQPRACTREAVFFGWLFVGAVVPSLHAQGRLQRTGEPGVISHSGIGRLSEESASAAIRRKLANIIIPSIEFRSTTVEDAVEFLRQESRRLDLDPDPEQRGLNIILRLPAARPAATASQGAARESQPQSTGPLLDPPVPSARLRITLTMNRIPLLEALKYVAVQAGLKVRVDPYAVSLVPLVEDTDALVTAVFHVSPTFIDSKNTGSGPSALGQAATSAQ